MARQNFITFLLTPKNWWLPLLIIFVVSFFGVWMIGSHTYSEAPPIPDFTSQTGQPVYTKKDILNGQQIFQKYALMEYGSMFGDGANRGPDYSAEALHLTAQFMSDYYSKSTNNQVNDQSLQQYGIAELVKREIKSNSYQASTNSVKLTEAQAYAATELVKYYKDVFQGSGEGAFKPGNYITDDEELRTLSAFFFWGSWVCGTERPGKDYSYTHNWPFDPDAGNSPSTAVVIWSIVGSLGLILGLGIVLYYHGKLDNLDDDAFTKNASPLMTKLGVAEFKPTATQYATYKYFYAAILLFVVQVLAGILTVHDFVGFVNFWGFDISEPLPITITRSWHVQLSLLWISACWIGASFFVMPLLAPKEPRHQTRMVNIIFWLIVVLVAGGLMGIFIGPKGLLGNNWYWFGHQGWEYLEPGKVWQILLYSIFILWVVTLYRGLRSVMSLKQPWALPNWLVYTTACILILLASGFMFTPDTKLRDCRLLAMDGGAHVG